MMIARHWRGWTKGEHAEGYEALLKEKGLPGLETIEGWRGGYGLRSCNQNEGVFVAGTLVAGTLAALAGRTNASAPTQALRGCV